MHMSLHLQTDCRYLMATVSLSEFSWLLAAIHARDLTVQLADQTRGAFTPDCSVPSTSSPCGEASRCKSSRLSCLSSCSPGDNQRACALRSVRECRRERRACRAEGFVDAAVSGETECASLGSRSRVLTMSAARFSTRGLPQSRGPLGGSLRAPLNRAELRIACHPV